MWRAQQKHKQEKNENVFVWKNSYARSSFKTCEGLVCIVHWARDGSWGCKWRSTASSGWTLCPPMSTGMGVTIESNPFLLIIIALRKCPVDTQGNAMGFSSQLLHMVESGLDILILVLNEAPAYKGLRAWVYGKMIPKLYTKPHDCSNGWIALVVFFSTKEAKENKKYPSLSCYPWTGSCCRKCTCQMPAIGLQTSTISSSLLLEVVPALPPWMLSVAYDGNFCKHTAGWSPEETRGRTKVYSAGWMYIL